jgi:hypothetical protein
MKLRLLALSLILTLPAFAVDGLYLGGEVGYVGLSGNASTVFNNNVGFGADLGVRANPVFDLLASFQTSSHSLNVGSGLNLNLYSTTLSAEFHFLNVNDLEFSIGAGPGMYFFKTSAGALSNTESHFGLQGGVAADVLVDNLRLGVGWRFHGIFHNVADVGASYWAVMAHVGYLFEF